MVIPLPETTTPSSTYPQYRESKDPQARTQIMYSSPNFEHTSAPIDYIAVIYNSYHIASALFMARQHMEMRGRGSDSLQGKINFPLVARLANE